MSSGLSRDVIPFAQPRMLFVCVWANRNSNKGNVQQVCQMRAPRAAAICMTDTDRLFREGRLNMLVLTYCKAMCVELVCVIALG
jgi:hypothetical protein